MEPQLTHAHADTANSATRFPHLTIGSKSAQLTCRFERTLDRWQTRIELLCGAGPPVTLLQSVEGSSTDPWPASPPLQDIQQLPGSPSVILATGMAGTGHWSVSMEATGTPTRDQIVWDAAVRLRTPPPASDTLGSVYAIGTQRTDRVQQPEARRDTPPESGIHTHWDAMGNLLLKHGEITCELSILPIHPTTADPAAEQSISPAASGETPVSPIAPRLVLGQESNSGLPTIAIATGIPRPLQTPQTLRWKYSLRISNQPSIARNDCTRSI